MSDDKECFFISPIGDEDSNVRDRSNKVMEYIIKKAVTEYGYSVTRADQMDEPGSITNQVIQKTVNSELVIADLTGHNPNVFYELAVRHATGEPYIQLIKTGESIPFDISDFRTIKYGLDVDEADQARERIRGLLQTLVDEEPEFDNPISESAEMQSLRESSDPADQNLAEILETMYKLDQKVGGLENKINNADSVSPTSNSKTLTDVTGTTINSVSDDGRQLYSIISQYQENNDSAMPRDKMDSLTVTKDRVEDALEELMMTGHVYQPKDGYYRAI